MRLSRVGRNPFERYTAKVCTMTIASKFLNNRPSFNGGSFSGTVKEDHENIAINGRFRLVDKLSEKSLSNLFNWVVSWNKEHSEDQRIPLV